MGLLSVNFGKGKHGEGEEGVSAREMRRQEEEGRGWTCCRCVFDGRIHDTAEENVRYMAEEFGFVTPDGIRLMDVEGFLGCLAEKVGVHCKCLCCDGQFDGVAEVQRHMQEVGHVGITHDDGSIIEEYSSFYVSEAGADGTDEQEVGEASGTDKASTEASGKGASRSVSERVCGVIGEKGSEMARKQGCKLVQRHAVGIAGRAAVGVVGGPAVAVVGGGVLTVLTAKAAYDAGGRAYQAVREYREGADAG